MDEIIERVARAMAENAGFCWENCAQSQWRGDARAGINAMRDMIGAAPELLAALRSCHCPAGGWTGIKDDTEPTIENCMREAGCGCVYGGLIRKAEGRNDANENTTP